MNLLLTGATGFVGRNISIALTAAGHSVRSISRSHGINFSSMLTPSDWIPHLNGVDAVINCVGIIGETGTQRFNTLHTLAPIALFGACEKIGVKRVIQISSLGADKNAFSQYHLSKLAADDMLRSLDLDWFVLRPSLIYGKGGASTEMFMRLAKLPIIPVIGDGQQILQPVHITDVVAVILQALTTTQTRQTLDIVGSEIFPYAEWLQAMRKAQRLPRARLIHIPESIAKAGLRIGRHINPMLHPDNLRMLQAGYHSDVQAVADFLGQLPKLCETKLFFSAIDPIEIKS